MTKQYCPMCERELGETVDRHHLIPKAYKGKEFVKIHKICHNKIHSVFTEAELAEYYHTIERIVQHEEIEKFLKWVRKKPADFFVRTKDLNERKRKRKR